MKSAAYPVSSLFVLHEHRSPNTPTKRGLMMKLQILPSTLAGKHLYSVDEAALLLGIGRDKVYDLIFCPDPHTYRPVLFSVKVGRLRKIPALALERYLTRLMEGA